jgi:hypothetical protein
MPKDDQTTTTEQPKTTAPQPEPQKPANNTATQIKPPAIPKIPESEEVYKSWGPKKKDS